MTITEVNQLRNFTISEHLYGSKRIVPYANYDFLTMKIIDDLRDFWIKPIHLIRGGVEHGEGKETAVDFVCPGITMTQAILGMCRVNGSWGVYRGGSIHLDRRELDTSIQHRWVGFRPADREHLQATVNHKFIGKEKDGWIYCAFEDDTLRELVYLEGFK